MADVGLVREALEEHAVHCELIVAYDGERAVQHIRALDAGHVPCPDLVILDLNLPRKPGRDVLQCIRASPKCNQVPIIVLTSSDHQRDRAEAENLGASLYIRKPSRLADFLALGGVFKETMGA